MHKEHTSPKDTQDLLQYCSGPLWVVQNLEEELKDNLAKVGGIQCESPSFLVTPELLEEPAKMAPKSLVPFKQLLQQSHRSRAAGRQFMMGGRLEESCAALEYVFGGETLVESRSVGGHGFISAIITAWSEHLPLVLKPEHIWLLILQGIRAHVDADPEGARDRFVDFQGKKTLTVRRDQFVKGSQINDWGGAIDEFGALLKEHVKPAPRKVFGKHFSTTTRSEELCGQLTAMAMCKHFFDFRCMTMCGFPTVTLLGTLDDWKQLRSEGEEAIRSLCRSDVAEPWLQALMPVLDKFVEAYRGRVDGVFWNSMIKRGGRHGSGGYSGFTGWFNAFFPIIENRFNRFCVPYRNDIDYASAGLKESWHSMFDRRHANENVRKFDVQDDSLYPKGTDQIPMTWAYYDLEFPMEFVNGFVGFTQDPRTKAITPVVSWYLLDKTPGVKVNEKDQGNPKGALESLRAQLSAAGA